MKLHTLLALVLLVFATACPVAPAFGQEADEAAAISGNVSGPFLVAGLIHPYKPVVHVLADSTREIRKLADFGRYARPRLLPQAVADIRAAAEAAGADDNGISNLTLVLVLSLRGRAADLHALLDACVDGNRGIPVRRLAFIVPAETATANSGLGEVWHYRACEWSAPEPPEPGADPLPVMRVLVVPEEANPDRVMISPEPSRAGFTDIRPGAGVTRADQYRQLVRQIRACASKVGPMVEIAMSAHQLIDVLGVMASVRQASLGTDPKYPMIPRYTATDGEQPEDLTPLAVKAGTGTADAATIKATKLVVDVEPWTPPANPWSGTIDPVAYQHRSADTALADDRVRAALEWLRDHQDEGGSWSPDGFGGAGAAHGRTGSYGNRNGSSDTGWGHARVGATALSLLAFTAAGCTHKHDGFGTTVRAAAEYLMACQDDDGCFAVQRNEDAWIYNHVLATHALIELYALTGLSGPREAAQRGIDFIASAQRSDDAGAAGWGYGVKPARTDSCITGHVMLVMASARRAGMTVPPACMIGARRHMREMTGSERGFPKTGYNKAAGPNSRLQSQTSFVTNHSMDALHICAQRLTGAAPTRHDANLRAQVLALTQADSLPTIADPKKVDYFYWYVGSLATFQMAGRSWSKWSEAARAALDKAQRWTPDQPTDACHGSWDSDSAWGPAGGRVYATAINCLTLLTPVRYQLVDGD